MKRILSVILSLALLASLLIIPMSVSAETSADDHISAIRSAAAGLQLNEAQKEQFYTPLGIFSNNNDYKTVCENVITNEDDKFTVGSKVIKLPVTFGSNSNFWEIPAGTDAVVSYQPGYVVDKLDDCSVKIPKEKLRSISFSVKTNIALTIDLRVHNGSINYSTKKINISASDNWQELKWDVSELGVAGDYIGSIFAVVNDENTNKKGFDAVANGDDAKVYFGGMFAETNVPDENVTAVNNAENLADCIVAAEKIDTSRYTDETVTALKSAITAAKTALIESYTSNSAALVNFVNSEIGVLSKTETLLIGVFGCYAAEGTQNFGSPEMLTSEHEAPNGCVPKNLYLSADENWRYISGTLRRLNYVSPGVTEFTNEGMGAGFTAGDYDDIYIYVVDNSYTSNSAFIGLLDQFGALNKTDGWVGSSATGFAVNAVLKGLDDNGHTKIFAHKTKLPIKSNGTYITSIYDDESVIKGFQILRRAVWTDGSEIGFSPMYGVKYCKETVTATSSREIYNGIKAIPVNEWDNGAVLTETADIIADVVGFPPVIKVDGTKAGDNYCGSAEVTVTDTDLVSVTVKGEEKIDSLVDGKLNITNTGDYTVVATDKKGNVTTKEFTVADHNYKYTAKGAVITETCANCDLEAKTLTLTKPATIVYDSNDKSGSIDVVKMTGFANAAGKGDIVFKNGETTVTEVKDAGNYVAELTIKGVTARLPFTVQQADLDHKDYAAPTVDVIEAGTTLGSEAFGANEKGAFKWAEPDTKVEYGSHTYKATFTPTDNNFKTVENIDVTVNGKDTTAPTGEIKIKDKTWIEKIVNVVFGWFINEKETVTITGSDAGSGVKAVYYYVADAAVDAETLDESAWKEYTGSFKIEKDGNNVVYAKIVDVVDKSTIISTDGIVLDTKAPSADVTNLGKYYGSLTVTVKDDNLDKVKLNDKVVTLEDGKFTVSAADKEQTIVITDKAGNETTYTVTVIEVKGFDPTEGGENATNPTVPGGTSPVTGQTAMTVVLFTILLGALAVMGISIVKSRKAKSK